MNFVNDSIIDDGTQCDIYILLFFFFCFLLALSLFLFYLYLLPVAVVVLIILAYVYWGVCGFNLILSLTTANESKFFRKENLLELCGRCFYLFLDIYDKKYMIERVRILQLFIIKIFQNRPESKPPIYRHHIYIGTTLSQSSQF